MSSDRVCEHFLRGSCKHGDRCRYAHPSGNATTTAVVDEGVELCKHFVRGDCKHGEKCRYAHVTSSSSSSSGKNANSSRERSSRRRSHGGGEDTTIGEDGWHFLPGVRIVLSELMKTGVTVLVLSKCYTKMALKSLRALEEVTGRRELISQFDDRKSKDKSLFTIFCTQRSEKSVILKKLSRTVLCCVDDNPECLQDVRTETGGHSGEHLSATRLFVINSSRRHQQMVDGEEGKSKSLEVAQTWLDVAIEMSRMKDCNGDPLLTLGQLQKISESYASEVKSYASKFWQPKAPSREEATQMESLFMLGCEQGKETASEAAYMDRIRNTRYEWLFSEQEDGDRGVVMVDIGNCIVTAGEAKKRERL